MSLKRWSYLGPAQYSVAWVFTEKICKSMAFLAVISTDDPLTDLFAYVTALEGCCDITFSLNIHALNFKM
jgi:hypothetical protein